MKILSIHHVAIKARDVERVAAFYRDVLGLRESVRQEQLDGQIRSVWLEVGGTTLLMIERSSQEEGARPPEAFAHDAPGVHLLALRIDPAEHPAVRRELEKLGVAIESETPYTVYVRDPEGNRVGLSSYPDKRRT